MARLAAFAALATLLAGCGRDAASYLINGADRSLTLVREQPYFWSQNWELALVTTSRPACMRRHALEPAPMDDFRLEVFRSAEGGYILRQGQHWYVTEMAQCRLQAFAAPPAEPGQEAGAFAVKDSRLQFIVAGR